MAIRGVGQRGEQILLTAGPCIGCSSTRGRGRRKRPHQQQSAPVILKNRLEILTAVSTRP